MLPILSREDRFVREKHRHVFCKDDDECWQLTGVALSLFQSRVEGCVPGGGGSATEQVHGPDVKKFTVLGPLTQEMCLGFPS